MSCRKTGAQEDNSSRPKIMKNNFLMIFLSHPFKGYIIRQIKGIGKIPIFL
jgi:hypothetical protein